MKYWLNPLACTGCGACAATCRQGCCAMVEDDEGFLRPHLTQRNCINCGECAGACPIKRKIELPNQSPVAYVAYHRDDGIRDASTSGGLFTLFATHILEQGGVVFGAAFDDTFQVVHKKITQPSQLSELRTSKYVQSAIGECFQQAKVCLEANIPVFFTGTPCQIGGLYAFLGKEYPHLLTQDFICHSVPSPRAWRNYLSFRCQGREIASVNFRDKTEGWQGYSLSIHFTDGTCYRQRVEQDPFSQAFMRDLCHRPSCQQCAYKTLSRQADITLADAWGIETFAPQYHDGRGVSLVLLHTKQALAVWSQVSPSLNFFQVDCKEALLHNPSITQSVTEHPHRRRFLAEISTQPFDQVLLHCSKRPLFTRVAKKIKRLYYSP